MLAKAAAAGSVLSAVWHLMLFTTAPPYWWGVPLIIGFFALWFPAVIGAGRYGFTFSGRGKEWMVVAALCIYAFISVQLLGGHAAERRVSLGVSAVLVALYAFAGAMRPPAKGVRS